MNPLPSGLSVAMFRQLRGVGGMNFRGVQIEPGDWVEASIFLKFPNAEWGRFGSPITRTKLEAAYRMALDDQQHIFRPALSTASATVPKHSEIEFAVVIASTVQEAKDAILGVPGVHVLLLDPEVVCPLGARTLGQLLMASLIANKADVAFPAMNKSEPVSLPPAGDAGSPFARLPGGLSIWEVGDALWDHDVSVVGAAPSRPGAALVTPAVAQCIADGFTPSRAVVVTTTSAFVWRETDASSVVGSLIDTSRGASNAPWAPAAESASSKCSRYVSRRPTVAFYSSAIGAWGGVAVLLRLADEFQELGAHAFVLHHHTATPHNFVMKTSPLKVRSANLLIQDWPRISGSAGGTVVVSNWGAGKVALDLAIRHPRVKVTSILQDREDLFEDKDGKAVGMRNHSEFIKIGRGASVSRWVIESAARDLGLRAENYEVIPAGIDLDIFHPPEKPRANGRIRILSMWRPQTDVRRGAKLLREVYTALHGTYGNQVSLELFGWNAPEGTGKAPSFATHHGHLTSREVAKLMSEVDIVVEPSVYQGFGLPGLEAFACGAALASTQCFGVDEYAVHGKNALVVPHEKLAEAVSTLIETPAMRQEFHVQGPLTAQRFAWPVIAAKWALHLSRLSPEDSALSEIAEKAHDRLPGAGR